VVRQIFWLSVTRNFHYGIFFKLFITPLIVYLLFVYPKNYFLFTSNFLNILFVYLVTALLNFLYYLCIVLKVLFVYPIKNTFYLQPRIMCICFCQLQELFVYHFKTTFYVPPRITCCLFLLTTYTYSPFQHITASFL